MVGSRLRSQIAPLLASSGLVWDPRLRLPEIGTGARASQYTSDTVRISDVRASRCGGVRECMNATHDSFLLECFCMVLDTSAVTL